jgi:hypothetical protein
MPYGDTPGCGPMDGEGQREEEGEGSMRRQTVERCPVDLLGLQYAGRGRAGQGAGQPWTVM